MPTKRPRPGIDVSSVIDPREDITVTAWGRRSSTSPNVIKISKSNSDVFDDIDKSKIKKMPKGSFKKGGQVNMMGKPSVMRKAAGGAAKVRKGMASPEGKIMAAMNKIRGN